MTDKDVDTLSAEDEAALREALGGWDKSGYTYGSEAGFYATSHNRAESHYVATVTPDRLRSLLAALSEARTSAPEGLLREARAMVAFVLDTSRVPDDHPIVKARRDLLAWFDDRLATTVAGALDVDRDTRIDRIKAALSINREYDNAVARLADIERIAYGPLQDRPTPGEPT